MDSSTDKAKKKIQTPIDKADPEYDPSTKVNILGLFKKGFQSEDWINATSLDLPARLKYKSFDEYEGKFGHTNRYYFEDSEGRDIRLLCKGKTFNDLIKKYVPIGSQIDLFKGDQGYWVFEKAWTSINRNLMNWR